ncbi:MAG: 16S rRNA (cytidine(1402)-2'-O)-methyltransferase [Betaproteobacteria bacterium]|nr:16S rRNA (cytidine(1402)-2'-O)-methyltransferase [Betaproteobacteria bacterium]
MTTLYVVATPIGNLRDLSMRALDVLAAADVIAAEDTRTTRHLLAHYALGGTLVALHEHNERDAAPRLLALLKEGRTVALVSDAGTPAISDPGAWLVAQARAAGVAVVPIPGPNAAITALSAAGIRAPHFLFYGFLAPRRSARLREIAALKTLPYLLVFYEAPHRVAATAADLCEALGGERSITFARELTKRFETLHTCPLREALSWLEADVHHQKGEFVLLVEGLLPEAAKEPVQEGERCLRVLLEELPLKQAVGLAAKLTGEGRNDLYRRALAIRAESRDA